MPLSCAVVAWGSVCGEACGLRGRVGEGAALEIGSACERDAGKGLGAGEDGLGLCSSGSVGFAVGVPGVSGVPIGAEFKLIHPRDFFRVDEEN
jgi:hypothetical protein